MRVLPPSSPAAGSGATSVLCGSSPAPDGHHPWLLAPLCVISWLGSSSEFIRKPSDNIPNNFQDKTIQSVQVTAPSIFILNMSSAATLPSSYSSLPFKDIKISHVPADSPTPTKVLIFAFNRPDQYNAATENLLTELETAYHMIDQDDRVRAVVLTGNGKAFCAGADLQVGFSDLIAHKETQESRDKYRDQSVPLNHYDPAHALTIPCLPGAAASHWP